MEKSFADVLNDAFSETFSPLFPDGDLNCASFNFDDKPEGKAGISHENIPTKEDEAQHQEVILSSAETKDMHTAENVEKEQSNKQDSQWEEEKGEDKTLEEDYTGSGGDSVSREEDEEEDMGKVEEPGELLMLACCDNQFCHGNKGDRIFAEGQPLAAAGSEKHHVRNKERGDSESHGEASHFERVPEHSGETVVKGDRIDENEQERESEKQVSLSGREFEGLAGCFEEEIDGACREGPLKASLESPDVPLQNVKDLTADGEKEERLEKMNDFSGEEHQEAGESFADYPSDFSSCEYIEEEGTNQESDHRLNGQQDACLEDPATDVTLMRQAEDSDEAGDECLLNKRLDAEKRRSRDGGAATGSDDRGKTGGSDSNRPSDDEALVKSCEERLQGTCPRDKNQELLEEFQGESRAEFADNSDEAAPSLNWNLDISTCDTLLSDDLFAAEEAEEEEAPPSDATQHPVDDVGAYSVLQRGDARSTSPSNLGPLDGSVFLNTELEASGVSEDFEDESYWEQEQERIEAFHRFYDGSDGENRGERRQIKVQFCTNLLSQVIRYETENSDTDSFSSSTDGEEDQSSPETSEVFFLAQELKGPEESKEIKVCCDLPKTQQPGDVPDLINRQNYHRKHRCLNMLRVTLQTVVVTLLGLLMFWLATDQTGWLSQMLFFRGNM